LVFRRGGGMGMDSQLIRRGFTGLFAGALLILTAARPQQQGSNDERGGEIVANLASGRVDIFVAKGAIVIGVLGAHSEPGSLAPQIVEMTGRRAAILMGALEWQEVAKGGELANLEHEVPALRASETHALGPTLAPGYTGEVAEDISQTGLGIYARMRPVVAKIHGDLRLGQDEPLIEAVLVGYVAGYGPDVWLLRYRISQELLREDYWQTQLLRPQYEQLWPPEKDQPKTLVEVKFPDSDSARLLDILRRGEGAIEPLRHAPGAAGDSVAAVLQGDTTKALPQGAVDFLRASFGAIAKPGEGRALAMIDEQSGFQWIERPPAPKEAPGNPAKQARPEGAPTLLKP
jgi:hypothetical protein